MSFGQEIRDFVKAYQAGDQMALQSRHMALQERQTNSLEKMRGAHANLWNARANAVGAGNPVASAYQQGHDGALPGDGAVPPPAPSGATPAADEEEPEAGDAVGGPQVNSAIPVGDEQPSTAISPTPSNGQGANQAIGGPVGGQAGEPASDPMEHMAYLVAKGGADPKVAAALVGNARHESNLDSSAVGDDGQSYGLYQFNVNGRRPAFEEFASKHGKDIKNDDTQHDFVLDDLKNNHQQLYNAMKHAPDAKTAAVLFAKGYERPKTDTAALDKRAQYADEAYSAYKNMIASDTNNDLEGAEEPPPEPTSAIPTQGNQ